MKQFSNKIYYILLAGCWCVSVGIFTCAFRAYVREIFKLIVLDGLGYVSQLNNVLFDGRISLSKMTENPVCDVNASATTNAEIKNAWITAPLPPFFFSVKFYFPFPSGKCVLRRPHKLKFIILYS
jgi:hypothetical protein